ncbi:polysaccharide pyruvyl transferase family protein [Mesorhizobium sp.]|uniref:polysaccharide pyruvyl transferase family protein n=1 Tax=Mesorhizobium sp. TaxID=1871066 RepID=UPI000FE619EE|nr:polysaccharide pyruvyl transferase family protein [Mesorhizobium sp.]RWO92563.1 MAG: polysaccharide pyruvyl transferase family protein [Mesorhizobium sp.]RWP32303.1 MAG: polysaccharide pyruvyl transferase family protein [Mesorhizobium sp.]RWQ58549.1 MAG: polysaccharide pyruvyl transferase family protein [Mesorhizobium sp.]
MRKIKVYAASTGKTFGAQPENYGDNLMAALLPALFNLQPEFVGQDRAELISTGSVIDSYHRRHPKGVKLIKRRPWRTLHVWGSGFMSSTGRPDWPQTLAFHAVRGPLSAEKLGQPGLATGDPALLLPRIWPKPATTGRAVAIVPHFTANRHFRAKYASSLPRHWKIVDLLDDPQKITRAIAESDMVISNSLHGLIVADAYGIPSVRIEGDSRIKGDGFKYRDYEAFRGASWDVLKFEDVLARSVDLIPADARQPDAIRMTSLLGSFPF